MDEVRRGREALARREWRAAYESLTAADEERGLAADEVELRATAAYMLGREDEWLELLERAHLLHEEAGSTRAALRAAFWLGAHLLQQGELARGGGWLARAQRLLERVEGDVVERGYLLLPLAFKHEAAGELEAAAAVAGEAAEIGLRHRDADLFALAAHTQGTILIRDGRVPDGLTLLDEAMVAATGGEVSPIPTGIVYCGVILACRRVFEHRRAGEWTTVLSRWCDGQPDLMAFTGRCLVHRAEIMQLHGSWPEALEEASRAGVRSAATANRRAAGLAFYRQGELRRLRGEPDAAEEAYREASRYGFEPQPGLALLRLAQGRHGAAAASIRRALAETSEPLGRVELLVAAVEIALAAGEADGAREGCAELVRLGERYESEAVAAMVECARGAVALAEGDPGGALPLLRSAASTWQALDAPYETARVRELMGRACRALGDEDAAELELDAARRTYAELGARVDLARVDGGREPDAHGLTGRELEVLRLVAEGLSNREIAARLVISEHTVARHLQNVFTKLRVSSRTAATAFAFEHALV